MNFDIKHTTTVKVIKMSSNALNNFYNQSVSITGARGYLVACDVQGPVSNWSYGFRTGTHIDL